MGMLKAIYSYIQPGEKVVSDNQNQNQGGTNPVKVGKGSSWGLVGLIVVVLGVVGALLFYEKSPLNLTNMLAGMQHDGRYMSAWRAELKSPDTDTRRTAVIAIGKALDGSQSTITTLCDILSNDPESDLRIEAALAMSKIKPDAPMAVEALSKCLKDDNLWVRINCSQTLGYLKSGAAKAVPALLEGIKDPKNKEKTDGFFNTIYETMVMTLAKVTAGTPEGVDVVCDALQGASTRQAKVTFIQAVSIIGAPARSRGESMLEKMKNDPDQGVSDEATYCLAVLKGEKAEPEAKIRPPQKGGDGKGKGGFPGGDFKGKGGFDKGGPGSFPKEGFGKGAPAPKAGEGIAEKGEKQPDSSK